MYSETKVSVVVITYNSQSTICETLDSVKNIEYEGPLELIIADDHSADNTIETVQQWLLTSRKRFCDVHIISPEQNTGTSKNMQRGYQAASGKYIRFLAGDDLIPPYAIRCSVSVAKQDHTKWVIGKTKVFGCVDDNLT